jgi:hypothetical protein
MFEVGFENADFALRHALVSSGSRLCLTWIPKVMCSSVKLSFLVNRGFITPAQLQAFLDHQTWIHSWAWMAAAPNSHAIRDTEKVVIIREPRKRFVSAFLDKIFYSPAQESDVHIFRQIVEFFAPFIQKNSADLTVGDVLEFFARAPDYTLDEHFRPQANFLLPQYDSILRFEDAEEVQDFFGERGITLYSANSHSTSRSGAATFDVSLDDRLADIHNTLRIEGGLAITFNQVVENRISELVRQRYSIDNGIYGDVNSRA